MAESFVNVTEGSGKKLHTNTRSIGGDTVHDEVVVLGEPYLASASTYFDNVSVATAEDHILQLMAGANNKLRIRKIVLMQKNLAGAVNRVVIRVVRLTTAGTGGSAGVVSAFDTADSIGAAARTGLTASKGTEGSTLFILTHPLVAAHPYGVLPFVWGESPNQKPIIVPAGTSNGIAIAVHTGGSVASATMNGWVEFDESSF